MANGVDIRFPTIQKAIRTITAITNDTTALITTDIPHQYVTGQIVRIVIPLDFGGVNNATTQMNQYSFGMVQINGKLGTILSIPTTTTFTVDIDTTNFDTFVLPPPIVFPFGPPAALSYAQVVPVGEINSQFNAATQNVLPYPNPYPPLGV